MTLRVFGAPHRYVQGPGALTQLGELAGLYGKRPLVIADAVVLGLLREQLKTSLGASADAASFAEFGGECTADEIARIAAEAKRTQSDLVIGVGGGKAIDTAKGVRLELGIPVIIVPTIASNDSPTSRLSVVYTPGHVLAEVRLMATNPDAVLVDTAIIIGAPERFFVSGVGDALSKKFEAAQCFVTGGDNFYKARPPYVALTLADACYAAIRAHAEGALVAVRAKQLSEDFERTVEATILLSGLAFENGGLSIAHSLTRGLSTVPELARALHGEQVAFGLLVQLLLEERPAAFVADLVDFYARMGLPRSLAQLGYCGDPERVAAQIARHTWERAPYVCHLTKPVDPARLEQALLAADALGSN